MRNAAIVKDWTAGNLTDVQVLARWPDAVLLATPWKRGSLTLTANQALQIVLGTPDGSTRLTLHGGKAKLWALRKAALPELTFLRNSLDS